MFDTGSDSELTTNQKTANQLPNPKRKFRLQSAGYKGLTLCFLNIGKLLTHIDELRIFTSENKPHIIDINETKLDHAVIDGEVEIDEYQIIGNDRNNFGGGVALYIHNNVPFALYDAICNNLEVLSIKLNIPYVKLILIMTIYSSTVDLFPKLEEL